MKKYLKRLRNRFLSPVIESLLNHQQSTQESLTALSREADSIVREVESQEYQIIDLKQSTQESLTVISKKLDSIAHEIDSQRYQINDMKMLEIDAFKANEILSNNKVVGVLINYEKILEKQYSKFIKPGNTVIDIGAHVGRHLAVFARIVEAGEVVAFEPLEKQYKYLEDRFRNSNVKLYNLALSNEHGEFDFYENIDYPEESGLKKRIYNNEGGVVVAKKVQVSTLDDVIGNTIKSVDYIKLDAEGAELSILEGAAITIDKYRPIISVEYGFPSYSVYGLSKDDLFHFCNDVGYIITDLFGNLIPTLCMWQKLVDSVYWDYFLVPYEKLEFFLSEIHSC